MQGGRKSSFLKILLHKGSFLRIQTETTKSKIIYTIPSNVLAKLCR